MVFLVYFGLSSSVGFFGMVGEKNGKKWLLCDIWKWKDSVGRVN